VKGVQEKILMHHAVTSGMLLARMVEWNIFWVCFICEIEMGVAYCFVFSEAI